MVKFVLKATTAAIESVGSRVQATAHVAARSFNHALTGLTGSRRLLTRSLALTPLVLTGACSSVDVLNALSSASPHRANPNIAFGPLPRHRLDIYEPGGAIETPQPLTAETGAGSGGARTEATAGTTAGTGAAAAATQPSASRHSRAATVKPARPVVVFFYGGSWNRGERKDYAFVGHSLAARGYVTVIPDYRLYPEVRFPDFLRDNAQAIAWVHANIARYGGDPQQLFVMGHSAGAYNASMMALDTRWLAEHRLSPDIFRGWVGVSGAYNFLPIGTPDVQPVFFHPNYPKDSQPIEFAHPKAPATFLATSPEDELINPKRNTFALSDRLKNAGVPTTLKTYDTVDHISIIASVAWPLRFKSPLLDDIDAFLKEQLRERVNQRTSELNTLSKSQ